MVELAVLIMAFVVMAMVSMYHDHEQQRCHFFLEIEIFRGINEIDVFNATCLFTRYLAHTFSVQNHDQHSSSPFTPPMGSFVCMPYEERTNEGQWKWCVTLQA